MTSSRFDQTPKEPYGYCLTCSAAGTKVEFATREELHEHLSETYDANKLLGKNGGHSARTTNPTRQERIVRFLQSEADDALDSALDEFITAASRSLDNEDATVGELTEAVKEVFAEPDWREAWGNYVDENELADEAELMPPLPPVPHTPLPGMEAL